MIRVFPFRSFPLPGVMVRVMVRVWVRIRVRLKIRGLVLGFRDRVRVRGYSQR